ncbi:MAG: gliding motility protein GldB [Tannerella sp.]|jgi:hypothetical protein|nr:gliding motility protein GldB [Tannerella sp.]
MLENTDTVHINRFDTALYYWIQSDDTTYLSSVKNACGDMFDLLGRALFQDDNTQTAEYNNKLINYFSEPTLKALYKDAITRFSPDSTRTKNISQELGVAFAKLKSLLPQIQIPAVYFHVSGLQQNFIVADSLISCSIDKYLGSDYPLYQDYFYDYQLKNMISSQIVNDYLTVWLKSENPFQGRENILLDRMIYEGKIIYLITAITKNTTYNKVMNLTDDEFDRLKNNESALWMTIIERKHLYTPDIVTTDKYFLSSPATFLSNQTPGNTGSFIGFRIVQSYINKTKSDCRDLMKNNDSQDILTKSKYKP